MAFGLAIRIVRFQIAANQWRFESLRTANGDSRHLKERHTHMWRLIARRHWVCQTNWSAQRVDWLFAWSIVCLRIDCRKHWVRDCVQLPTFFKGISACLVLICPLLTCLLPVCLLVCLSVCLPTFWLACLLVVLVNCWLDSPFDLSICWLCIVYSNAAWAKTMLSCMSLWDLTKIAQLQVMILCIKVTDQ